MAGFAVIAEANNGYGGPSLSDPRRGVWADLV
jgi:hypothetical protein